MIFRKKDNHSPARPLWLLSMVWWTGLRLVEILSAPTVASQLQLLAITLSSGSWHRLSATVPICKGSSLKWLLLAVGSITKLQGSNNSACLEGHLPPFSFLWCLFPALSPPFLGATCSRVPKKQLESGTFLFKK